MKPDALERPGRNAGYTAVEALTVVAVMGAVAALTTPSMLRFQGTQQVQAASSQVGGMLQKARARAIADATPHLVLFQEEDVTAGRRTPFALLVKDNDRSYTLTPADEVESFSLDASTPAKVRQYGVAPEAPLYPDMAPPETDRSSASTGLVGGLVSGLLGGSSGSSGSGSESSDSDSDDSESGSDSSGSGGGLLSGLTSGLTGSGTSGSSGTSGESAPSETSASTVGEAVTNGATFPVSEADGVPAIAFNEQGIPVSPAAPQQWGSGSGAVYLTDNEHAVFAVVVSPLGAVEMARYDAASSTWKK